jgi:hypothetical protein
MGNIITTTKSSYGKTKKHSYKLLSIHRTPDGSSKRYIAKFEHRSNGSQKNIKFGAKRYSNYTIHKNKKRKENYLNRHRSNEDWTNPLTPGALSRWILWNKPSLNASKRDFVKRFHLD